MTSAAAERESATLNDDQIHEAIMRLISNGQLEISVDDSDIRKAIAKLDHETATKMKVLLDSVPSKKEVADKLAELAKITVNAIGEVAKGVEDKIAAIPRPESSVTFDEAKLRQISDEVAQNLLSAKVAKSIAAGETTPLPPLLKLDPFFVENAQTDRIALCLSTRRHSMCSGPSGSGKTYPIEQVLRKRGVRYLTVSVADGLTMADFLARPNVRATDKGTETFWTYGFLPYAMLNGLVLVLDEIDQCQPEIVSILNKALEARSLYIPQTGETVTAKPEWQVFMTCNTLRDTTGNYSGFRMNAALLNRVVFIKADYLEPKDENAILQRVGLSRADAAVIVGIMQGLRAAYVAGKLTQAPSTRIAVRVARCVLGQDDDGKKCSAAMKLDEAFAFCLLDGLPDTEVKEALAVFKNGI